MMNKKDILVLYNDLLRHLHGDWVLTGGGLLHVLGISERVAIDIDLVPLNEITNSVQLMIMDIAEKNGFPPEVINFSAEYFLKKQKNWQSELVILYENKDLRIFRPTKKLFKAMKQQRGTETDLSDIELFDKNVQDK
jgi:hypothetical protein